MWHEVFLNLHRPILTVSIDLDWEPLCYKALYSAVYFSFLVHHGKGSSNHGLVFINLSPACSSKQPTYWLMFRKHIELLRKVGAELVTCGQVCVLSLTLCDPMDCSPPGTSARGIFQARILEWVAVSYSRESSQPRDWTHVSCIGTQILYHYTTWDALSWSLKDIKIQINGKVLLFYVYSDERQQRIMGIVVRYSRVGILWVFH